MAVRLLKNASHAIARRWAGRRYFSTNRDWLTTLYDAALRYSKKLPLPLRRRRIAVNLAHDSRPIYLRMGSSDGFVLEEIFVTDVYAPLNSQSLGDVKQIVDLGANAGYSVRLWRQRFPAARVVAVEPDAGNFAACKKNIGEDSHVCLVQAAVAARAGTVYLDRSAEECAIAVTDRAVGEPVEALALPAILDRCELFGPIDLLKVDIEGAEEALFENCASWIGRVNAIMIELHGSYTRERLEDDLRRVRFDFEIAWSSETAGNPLLFLRRTNESMSR